MARRTYRTNKGAIIDMEAMRAKNEKTIAAGNMKVNAKGDVVKGGKVVKTAKARVTPSYTKVTQVADASLKKPLSKADTTVAVPKTAPPAMAAAEMTTETVKVRDDGSKYKEIVSPTGDIEVKEIDAPEKAPEPKPKKTSKKTKRPSV